MTRTNQAARRGKSNKRPYSDPKEKTSQDAPPSKKVKTNPPSSNSTNTIASDTTQENPTSTLTSASDPSKDGLPTLQTPINAPDLRNSHDLTTISVRSSTQIKRKVLQILETLSAYPTPPNQRPKVFMMKAKAGVASKMISIAEIAKRELGKEGGKWFQYNFVEGVMVEHKKKPKKKGQEKEGEEDKDAVDGGRAADGKEESEEDSAAFETMKTPFERANEGKSKVRAVPVMTIYLSRVRIDALRKAFGEQTNALQSS